jgi:hypothetical protein
LLGEQGGSEEFADITETVDVGIQLDLRVVVENKPVEQAVCIEQKGKNKQRGEQTVASLRGQCRGQIHHGIQIVGLLFTLEGAGRCVKISGIESCRGDNDRRGVSSGSKPKRGHQGGAQEFLWQGFAA